MPALFVNPGKYRTRLETEVEQDIVRLLQEAGVELVVLAGFMRVLKEPLLKAFPKSIINIHPSLLPKYKGLEAWKQALEAGEKVTGCTVHYVDAAVDAGHVLGQREVAIQPTIPPLHYTPESRKPNTTFCPRWCGKSRLARKELGARI